MLTEYVVVAIYIINQFNFYISMSQAVLNSSDVEYVREKGILIVIIAMHRLKLSCQVIFNSNITNYAQV